MKTKNRILQSILRLSMAIIFGCTVFTLQAQRESKTINDGWKFLKGEATTASDSLYNDSNWETVHIPHTWNTDAYTDKDYYKGICWYRKSFTLPQAWKDKQLFLKFDAASKTAVIYLNGKKIGEHKGGYTAFSFDITPYCSFTSPNVLAIQADNASQDAPPISGDFTFFGGIYRDVWLTATPKQHFHLTNAASDGVFISTPQVSEQSGSLLIRGEIKNDAATKAQVEIEHTIYAPDGTWVQTQNRAVTLKAGELYSFTHTPTPIREPQLWSPETPRLYRVETILRNKQNKQILDQLTQYTGFRWYRFDGNEGFFLNGKPYKLRGICRHQDQKPIGVALTDEMHRRDMLLMKEMGANFIRISHYPQDDAILEQCDKLGMLAWEEIPVIDIVPDSEAYAATCEQNLREMIRQHYNHPSVITWGYMNEILLVTLRRYKERTQLKPVIERTIALANRLEKALKEEDSYRVSTMAFHGSNAYNELGLGTITDVVGWNLYSGWYGGELDGFNRFVEEQHRNFPTHPMIISEYGAGSDKRLHSMNPRSFDFSIEYQQKYLEHYVRTIEDTPYICGGTHWNFIDFASALRDESMPRINNKGLVYSNRTPKDVYHYFKAVFRKDAPVLYIASRDWQLRSGIQEPGQPVVQPVKVYTNLPEVELFVNGKSLGKKQSINCTIVFDVPFQSGDYFVRAVSHANGKQVEDGMNIRFNAIPSVITGENIEGLELAVNVGSNCSYTSDESQLTWLPDRTYTPGGWGYLANEQSKKDGTQTEIKHTTDEPLFQTLQSNLEGYRFDVPQGEYEVELLFADIFRETEKIAYQLGRDDVGSSSGNTFAIRINDKLVEEAFSPANETGYFEPVKKRYLVQAGTEGITIRFETIHGKSFLNGIKVRRIY